jgi:hypothetical protein
MIILTHIGSWILFFSLILGFTASFEGNNSLFHQLFSLPFLIFSASYMALYYLNGQVLVPRLYLSKRHLAYFAVLLFLLFLVFLLKPFDHFNGPHSHHRDLRFPPGAPFNRPPEHHPHPRIDIISVILFLMVWAVSTSLVIINQWRQTEKRAAQAEADKTQAELSFLKAQINPHFLFNTLNNIYSLAVMKAEATPQAILKLSGIMRYVTDEVAQDKMPLSLEVECVRNYIDLQQLRLNEKVTVDYAVEGSMEQLQIAPLVLMTFVENIFKYGISSHETSVITIRISVKDHLLDFFCQNRIFQTGNSTGRPGIGIENTKKRLQYLYPGMHTLQIQTDHDQYIVHLEMHL